MLLRSGPNGVQRINTARPPTHPTPTPPARAPPTAPRGSPAPRANVPSSTPPPTPKKAAAFHPESEAAGIKRCSGGALSSRNTVAKPTPKLVAKQSNAAKPPVVHKKEEVLETDDWTREFEQKWAAALGGDE